MPWKARYFSAEISTGTPRPGRVIKVDLKSLVLVSALGGGTPHFIWGFHLLSVQLLSRVWLFVTPWTAACQASLSITNSWSLLKLMSIELVMPSNHPSSVIPFSSCSQSSPASRSFPMSQFFASGGQRIGVSASASVLPMNIQDWFPLGRTGWISLLSMRLSRVFSQFQSINFSALSFLYGPTLTSIHDYWKNHSVNYTKLCWQSHVSCFLICCLGWS